MKKMIAGIIYRAKKGHIYDNDNKKYDCYIPMSYADKMVLGDCLIVDQNGNRHPDFECAVPVGVEALGEIIGKATWSSYEWNGVAIWGYVLSEF